MIKERAEKYKEQLGMSPSTARSQLLRLIIWSFIENTPRNKCWRCKEQMTKYNFSIEHKKEWLHSENPIELYLDTNNIDFSHNACNSKAKRYMNAYAPNKDKITHGTSGYRSGCRCETCVTVYSADRKARYKRTGK